MRQVVLEHGPRSRGLPFIAPKNRWLHKKSAAGEDEGKH
jgi:hypothetical protein